VERQYREAFSALNSAQRQAVETIDGPVMVIAGPGTGKTQLISARAGYILQHTDTPADAILLLTFTEAGVDAMRQRLLQLIGRPAYDIQLSTYHAFGGEIFRRYPDYFEGAELTLLEELSADTLLRGIISKLPYSDPLKFADSYIGDLKTFISEAKRALLTPEDIRDIASDNLKFIDKANRSCRGVMDKLTIVSPKTVRVFEELLGRLSAVVNEELPDSVLPLARYAQGELDAALEHYRSNGKTTLLTQWKRHWLARDAGGDYIFDGRRLNERLQSAGRIYGKYQQALRRRRLYDYDDMIIRAIDALQTNSELRYSLAERYSYIMLDEFQDTNPAQFKLVQLLSDHPVHEGRPNVLAVGDDDQAIYAFQGADHANMAAFLKHYKDVRLISLTKNYRAAPPLLSVAANITSQIQSRLVGQLEGVTKQLQPAVKSLPEPPHLQARVFKSDAAQYDWVASEIQRLQKQGVTLGQIAVLAPKHRYLTAFLPYLNQYGLPVSYEHRENILDQPLVHQLEQMSRLVIAVSAGDDRLSNHLWPEVLSYDFWNIPISKIWQLSWQSRQAHEPWTSIMLNDEQLEPIASLFLKLASLVGITPLEKQLDALIGLPESADELKLPLRSPLYEYYFSKASSEAAPLQFERLISDLNVLRSRLSEWRRSTDEPLGLRAFVEFIEGHRAAGINILNASPYEVKGESVNLMTAYGAKGREFQAVFIIGANDEIWGSASRNQGYRLSLPSNLSYIRYQGASEDERLRLLYVAATRAKTRLYITGYQQDLAGKSFSPLKYLEISESDGQPTAGILPDKFKKMIVDRSESIGLAATANYWTRRHVPPFKPSLKQVLEPRLKDYRLSATDLNHFIDIVNYGPEEFFIKCLLRFPSAPAVTDSFGTAVHNSLRFAGRILQTEGALPTERQLTEIFEAQLGRVDLEPDEYDNLARRGIDALSAWLKQSGKDLKPEDRFEYDFQNEGSRLGDAALGGKVDRMKIDEKHRSITVLDYKTGKSYARWQSGVVKLHYFQRQLIFYKLLIESSARYRKYKVESGIIEFVEPDADGRIQRLQLHYDEEDMKRQINLMSAVWRSIQSLKLPDASAYPATLAGIRQFEDDLIGGQKNTG
jgi:DNA helicase-2/ATP-dependent DNA helicase PcrA